MTDEVAGTYGHSDDDADLRGRQDGRLYTLGRALRATYHADNHATLGQDVTGLMLDLSRVPFEPHEFEPLLPPPPPAVRPGWLTRVRMVLRQSRARDGGA